MICVLRTLSISLILTIFPLLNAQAAQRVVVLAPDLVENIFTLGAGAQMVGRVSGADYPERALSIPVVGDYQGLNYEAILAVKPDLVIAWKEGSPAVQLEKLESLGLRVERISSSRISDLPKQFLRLGEVLGVPEKGKIIATRIERQLQDYQRRDSGVRVFYELWSNPLLTVNHTSWINDVVQICGADNPFSNQPESVPQIALEAVLQQQVDMILGSSELPDNWKAKWLAWPSLPAVKHNKLYTVNADYLHRLTLRTLKGIDEVCHLLDKAEVNDGRDG